LGCGVHGSTEYPSAKDVKQLFGDGGAHAMTSLTDYVLVGVPRDVLQYANSLKVERAILGPTLVTPGGFRQVRQGDEEHRSRC
jgi:hypothetical protein